MEQRLIDANALLKKPLDTANYPSNYVKNAQTVITIPENATNGDMIKAMFPELVKNNLIMENRNCDLYVTIEPYYCHHTKGIMQLFHHNFNFEWWNAPYKAESVEE